MSDAAVSAPDDEVGLSESSDDRGGDGERLSSEDSEELLKGGSPSSGAAGEVLESAVADAVPTADASSVAQVAQDDENNKSEAQDLSPPPQPTAASAPDSGSTAPDVCERCKKFEEELELSRNELELSRNKELRLRADLDNSKRKHLERLKVEVSQSESDLLRQLLPGLDALDAAFIHHPEVVEPLRIALLKPLEKVGLKVIAPEGQDFDPEWHEAVSFVEKDGAEREMVSEVLSKGYVWRERVLRHAQVRVER